MGGRVYPGEHHRARFRVAESEHQLHVGYTSVDGTADVDVKAVVADGLEVAGSSARSCPAGKRLD